MFFHTNSYQTLLSKIENLEEFNQDNNVYLPLELDTEYQEPYFPYTCDKTNVRKTLTVQIKGVHEEQGVIFKHTDIKDEDFNIPSMNTDFIVIDYLILNKYKVFEILTEIKEKVPVLYIDFFGFFSNVDFLRMVNSSWKEQMIEKVKNQKSRDGIIAHDRRLRAYTRYGRERKEIPYVFLNKYLSINSKKYSIAIGFRDNVALQGSTTYANLCINTNINLKYKQNYNEKQKQYMKQEMSNDIESFVQYALGDLSNFKIYNKHTYLLKNVYKELNLTEYFNSPKYTIGNTTSSIFKSSLQSYYNITEKELIKYTQYTTHKNFLCNESSTAVYLAKTNGGRCINNRPLDITTKGPIVDIDISSCYGYGLKLQEYPLGRPVILQYDRTSKCNKYLNLKEFLRLYRHELVEGLWMLRVSTYQELTTQQDYFYSWIPPIHIKDLNNTDVNKIEQQEDELTNDASRVYTREINLAVLQHDDLEWIERTCSSKQRDEMLNNLYIHVAAFYPKSKRVNTIKDLKAAEYMHKGRNTCKLINSETIESKVSENHHWTSINIGNLLITKLIEIRKKHNKEKASESSMNNFLKLIINAIYGDLVSPYFDTANTIVGNNITARARSMAWHMEKGLNGFQTITDGCCFELNKVAHEHRYRINSEKLTDIKKSLRERKISIKPLMNKKVEIDFIKEEIESIYTKEEIEKQIKKHLEKLFPNIKVIKQYDIEIKNITTQITTHGASNYQTKEFSKIIKTKMRSYKHKEYQRYKYMIEDEKYKEQETYEPIKLLFENLSERPRKMNRIPPFIETKIIKTKNYNIEIKKLEEQNILPGNTKEYSRLLTEFTLSTYKFKTHKQYSSWNVDYKTQKLRYGQSYESNYIDKEDKLNYEKMIKDIHEKIERNYTRYQRGYLSKPHPYYTEHLEYNQYIEENQKTLIVT